MSPLYFWFGLGFEAFLHGFFSLVIEIISKKLDCWQPGPLHKQTVKHGVFLDAVQILGFCLLLPTTSFLGERKACYQRFSNC